MNADYSDRQHAGKWPTRKPWNPEGLPPWYLELIGAVAADLTAWRHDPPQRLDPRCDPRCPRDRTREERRHAAG